jgi:microcystin-dependent protein
MSALVSNNAYSTLASSLTAIATSLTVATGEGSRFPAASTATGAYFYATIIDTSNNLEIVKVTNRSSDTFTLVRAQDGSSARAFSSSDRIELRPVAALFTERTIPAGALMPYAGAAAPTGWLLCDGSAVSRTTYAALFAVLSTTYGVGDGSSTFNLPDLRGRVIAGQDDMGGSSANRLTGLSGGVDGDTLGAAGGAESHTLTSAEIPAHTHPATSTSTSTSTASSSASSSASVSDPGHSHSYSVASPNVGNGSSSDSSAPWQQSNSTTNTGHVGTGISVSVSTSVTTTVSTTTNTTTTVNNNTGGGGAHNNVQPTMILNYMIKT